MTTYRKMRVPEGKVSKLWLFLFGFLFLFSGCGSDQPLAEDQPNIVWLVTEDNAWHWLRHYDSHGAAMPHIEQLAAEGITFRHAFSNAPVCSVARSTLISGCYAPRIGAQYHRKQELVSLPEGLEMFPYYLRKAGYYTSNNAKEDYNIIKGDSVWDASSREASYTNRQPGQPFFHVQNFGVTHEGQLHFPESDVEQVPTHTVPDSMQVFPYHPDTELFRYTYARLQDHHLVADSLIGAFMAQLEAEGLMEETIIFYYGDHGGVLPRSKGYLYESGLHVPLVVYFPPKWRHLMPASAGSEVDGFVSFVDFAPTVLELAGITVPEAMDGRPFLGESIELAELNRRQTTIGYADRFDEKYDFVRSLRRGRFKYIRNYQSYHPDALFNFYRYRMPAYRAWQQHYADGNLSSVQQAFFQPRPAEQLFDVEADPHETVNLAAQVDIRDTLLALRHWLQETLDGWPDLSFYPEPYFLYHAVPMAAQYGSKHRDDIVALHQTADAALLAWHEALPVLLDASSSADPWQRYWAYVVASNFMDEAQAMVGPALQALEQDPENLVRMRAAEFLALRGRREGIRGLVDGLARAADQAEANMVLNSLALIKGQGVTLPVDDIEKAIKPDWHGEPKTLVDRRLEYLLDR